MKPKQIIRMAADIAMTALLLLLMAFMLTGQEAHEWLDAAELVLFTAHHVLIAGWLKNIGHGKYTPFRILQTLLALLVLLTMLGSMVSGIMMSRYVFAFLDIHGGMALARAVRMACAYWGFILLSAHLGLHWSMMMGMAKKAAGIKGRSAVRTAVRAALRGVPCHDGAVCRAWLLLGPGGAENIVIRYNRICGCGKLGKRPGHSRLTQ